MILFLCDLWGLGDFRRAFCCWRARFFLRWGSGRLCPCLAPGAYVEAVYQERVVYFSFLLTPLASASAWLGAGGEREASDGMITVAMSRVRWRFVVPGMFCRGQGRHGTLASVAGYRLDLGRDGLVLRFYCLVWTLRLPRNDPSGAKECGGWG